MVKRIILGAMLWGLISNGAIARLLYVSNSGNDNNNGTSLSTPWQTCGKATSTATAGDTVYFMGGTYYESHSTGIAAPAGEVCTGTLVINRGGTSAAPIVYKAHWDYPRPIFQGWLDPAADNGDIAIVIGYGASYVIIDSLIATRSWPQGIRIGNASNVSIKNCVAHDCGNHSNDNAAGIGVLYDPSYNITVKNCSTYAIYNYPFSGQGGDVNTHGICVYRCTAGVFDGNTVFNIGGTGVGIRLKWLDTLCVLSNNIVRNCFEGMQLGTGSNQNSAFGNIIYDISWEGLVVRGTAAGGANNLSSVYNNTLYNCVNAGIVVFPNDPVTNCSIWNNIVVNCHNSGSNHFNFSVESGDHTNLSSNYNCYFNTNTSTIAYWIGSNYTMPQLRTNTNLDLNSGNVDPVFANPSGHDFRLTTGSPAIVRTGGRPGYLPYMGALNPDSTPPPPRTYIDQIVTKSSTQTTATLVDDLIGGTAPYDSLILYWSATRANVANLSARDTKVTAASDPYTFSKTALTPATKYYFRISAFDTGVTGDTTAIDSVVTTSLPAIDQIITKTPADSSISLTDNLSGGTAPYDSLVLYWSVTRANVVNLTARDSRVTAANSPYIFRKTGLTPNTKYYFRVSAFDSGALADTTAIDSSTTTIPGLALLSVGVPDTESGTYPGYSTTPVNDGVIDPRGANSTWASDESATAPHWVEMTFASPKIVQRAIIRWAWNGYNSSWMSSQQFNIQYWNSGAGAFQDIVAINANPVDSITAVTFSPVTTSRIRYWQPANMGPSTYPSILWLTELEYYGSNVPSDTIPPAAIQDLNAIPDNGHGQVRLEWTVPGDNSGSIYGYAIKYSQNPIDDLNWDDALAIDNPPTPIEENGQQSFVIGSLSPGEVYYWAIKSFDATGNISRVSNSPDTFASGIAPPAPSSTVPDGSQSNVTVSCYPVNSYYSIYYEFALDISRNFENQLTEPALLAGSLVSAVYDNLSSNQEYYWRCRAMASGRSDSSEWSEVTSFSLNGGTQPVLADQDCLYPTEGEVVATSRPDFAVRRPDGIDIIYLQVADNLNFDSPQASGPITANDSIVTWSLGVSLEHAGTYYWRAGVDNSNWTSAISFSANLDIHPYPNPYRAEEGHTAIVFTNLPRDSKLTIATISGNVVKSVNNTGTANEWTWDVRNDDGQNVASGVYLYRVSYNSGSSSGKVMIIR